MTTHLIGLSLGIENDWSTAFETLVRRAGLDIRHGGDRHRFETERVRYEPFDLRSRPRYALVIDRVAWWYPLAREWLKKIAMMDEVYLLNDPYTFQSMEKHTAYCAMMRLGLRIPTTWMLPHKDGPPNDRYAITAERYNDWFDLEAVAGRVGYPFYMKPFDGGGWRGVSRIDGPASLHASYDESRQSLMHIQEAVEPFDYFTRSLSIGPQTRVMNYRPDRPLHDRYSPETSFLQEPLHTECATISQVINAFFRWEFNSSEALVRNDQPFPIDFANACPDVAIISLHAHFPWAMSSLLKWTVFCLVTGRRMAMDMNKRDYFAIADRDDLDYAEKLAAYRGLAMAYFDAERFYDFADEHLAHLDEVIEAYFDDAAFDELLVETMKETFPAHEQDQFIDRYRMLVRERARATA